MVEFLVFPFIGCSVLIAPLGLCVLESSISYSVTPFSGKLLDESLDSDSGIYNPYLKCSSL